MYLYSKDVCADPLIEHLSLTIGEGGSLITLKVVLQFLYWLLIHVVLRLVLIDLKPASNFWDSVIIEVYMG